MKRGEYRTNIYVIQQWYYLRSDGITLYDIVCHQNYNVPTGAACLKYKNEKRYS